jgi:hypothetical protein
VQHRQREPATMARRIATVLRRSSGFPPCSYADGGSREM